MNNEQKPQKPKRTWKLIVGIILCIYFFFAFLLFLSINPFLALLIGGSILTVGILLIASYVKAIPSPSKEEIEKQQRQTQTDLYFSEKMQQADQYYQQQKENADQYVCNLQKEIENLKKERDSLIQDTLAHIAFPAEIPTGTSDEIKNQMTLLRQQQTEMVKNGQAIKADDTLNAKTRATQSKQLLRCFNAECSVILDKVTLKNADASREKIARSYETLNRIFAPDGVQLTPTFLQSKLEELNCAHAVLVKLEEEKEQRRAIREQMVEEEKVRKEIEREKQKIEKEEAQFSGEIKKLLAYMQKARDEVERNLYLEKIDELQKKLDALQKDKDNVLQREQNTRAGFVYIISNIGSFGEQVYKIGMTRRLEPMDRIAELSSASVPFPFDVHAMIFSDDAPALETVLHQHFDAQRVNRINPRKEFFRIDLDEIKKVVLENHNATVQFIDTPDATEYRETIKLMEKP